MIDFTALPTRNKFYAGANGAKIAVIYDGEQYMLKFPAPAPKNKELSYANSCISEYIGCHIFNSVGIAAQETLLGIYRKNGAEKIVVACKDFTSPGIVLRRMRSTWLLYMTAAAAFTHRLTKASCEIHWKARRSRIFGPFLYLSPA